MKALKSKYIYLFPVIVVVLSLAIWTWGAVHKEPATVIGTVEVKEIDIASKIPGRIDSLLVNEGDSVQPGQVLAVLESKEISAKVAQARAVMEAAKARYDMALNGARPEQKEAVQRLYLQAKHQFEFARKTYQRIKQVYQDSVVSRQDMDEIEFKYKAAKEQMEAAKAKYEMVLNGAREEEIRAARALYEQTKNAYREALSYQEETRLVSPIAGTVQSIIADPGEIIAAGYPIVTLIDPTDTWIVLNLREDQLSGLKNGDVLEGTIPALNNKRAHFKITYIAGMADFATWRATNQKGDFDLKTFEIHLKPENEIEGLRAGMTVRLILPEN